MTKNKINICEYSGDDCTWCQKRIFDNDKNIIKLHFHDEIDNSILKTENDSIKILEMFHKKCMKKKLKLEIKERKYNEKIIKFTRNGSTDINNCVKCQYGFKHQIKLTN